LETRVRIPISLLNIIPAPIAARFRNQGLTATILRAIVHRTMTSDEVVAVVRSGHGRGIRLTLDPMREKYYWAGKHDVPVQDALVSILHPGSVFWDVGAHVGFFSILAARAVSPGGQVHAFEPMPHNRHRLERAVQLNRAESVVVHEFAMSDRNAPAELHGHSASAMWTLVAERGEFPGVDVACRTIDSLASDLGDPDAIKIDVEGAELDVLRGGLATIERSHPTLVVEFAVPEYVQTARRLLPAYSFERLSGMDWLLAPSRDPGTGGA
jgi:FkbM family methyltransferase